ncbi:MAG: ABC transporter permease [Clostridiales bacterium]|nr:ABC transporter permease [Clostridiales bacterium]
MLITRLAFANMRKKKGTSITLVIFILLATMCFNIGMKLGDKCDNLVMEKVQELSAPDFVASCNVTKYKQKYETYLLKDPRVAKIEKDEVIYMPTTKNNKNTLELGAVMFNCNTNREIAPMHLVKEDTSVPADQAIYVPMILQGFDVKLGDAFSLTCKGKQYDFIVAGFFETTYYGTSLSGMLKYFVTDEGFQRLYAEVGRAMVLSVQLEGSYSERLHMLSDFQKEFKDNTDFNSSLDNMLLKCVDLHEMKDSCMAVLAVISALLIAFAMILCIVILVVIVNRVIEHIEENMQNIGVLQAMGYTSKHIIGSVVVEFGLLSLIGCILGTALTYIVLPTVKNVFTMASGLETSFPFTAWIDLICIGIVVFAILIATGLTSLRILQYPPVKALNKGMKSHHFGKNICPLYKGVGKVHFRIAVKNIFENKKQNIMFTLVLACSTFVVSLMIIVYINFATDRTMMFQMLGMELSDVQVEVTKQTDIMEFSEELLQMEEVRKTNLSDLLAVTVDDIEASAITSIDFSKTETLKPYRGTLPKYENEVVLTGVMLKLLKKDLGDTVTISAEGRAKEFYIVGEFQSTNENGKMLILPYDGVIQIRPQYKIRRIDVYLNDGYDKDQFKEKLRTIYKVAVKEEGTTDNLATVDENAKYSAASLKAEEKIAKLLENYGIDSISYTVMLDGKVILAGDSYDYKIADLGDYIEFGSGQLDTFSSMTVGLVGVVALISLVIIGGILSITIKSMIRKKRVEYGIYKALGYTTKEIVYQISMNYAISALIGVLIGIVSVLMFGNKLLEFFFQGMGLTQLGFAIPYPVVLLLGIGLIAYTYGIAIWKAYQVKKITAYDLLIE